MPYTTFFSSGPAIHVLVQMNQGLIQKSLLSQSNTFSCTIEGASSDKEIHQITSWLDQYSKGITPIAKLPLNTSQTPSFHSKVLKLMQRVPFGSTMSYKGLASSAGNARASRAVGNVCRSNLFPLFIPCHRILKSDGSLGGFAFGLPMKEQILAFEKKAILASQNR